MKVVLDKNAYMPERAHELDAGQNRGMNLRKHTLKWKAKKHERYCKQLESFWN